MRAWKRFFIFFFLFLFVLTPLAQADGPWAPDNHNKPDPLSSQKQLQGNFNVGEFTGAAIYDYPISLPAGRNGMAPALSFTYNSQNDNMMENVVGYRWDITQFSIKRFNKHGVERIYESTDFVASTPVGGGELVPITLSDGQHGTYGLKVENAFARYEFLSDGSWVVTDKQGTKYRFGMTEESRQFDPDDSSRVYQWMLSEIRDTNDNFIRYTYEKGANQIYPKAIFYTGHGSEEGIFEVRFLTSGRTDGSNVSYARGFRVQTTSLISKIEVYANAILRREAALSYSDISSLGWQTLRGVTETAYDESGVATSLPATTFDYTESRVGFQESADYVPDWFMESCDNHKNCTHGKGVVFWDMNGDGLTDFEYMDNNQRVRAVNNGQNGWRKEAGQYVSPGLFPTLSNKLGDFDGDARADFFYSSEYFDAGQASYSVSSGVGLARGGSATPNPLPIGMAMNSEIDNGAAIGDLNGDGLPDMIQSVDHLGQVGNASRHQTCLNRNGERCEFTTLWQPPANLVTYFRERQSERNGLVADCNLDGLADFFGGGRTWVNNGKGGWVEDACPFGSGAESNTFRHADMNGDGLLDSISAYYELNLQGNPGPETRAISIRTPSGAQDFEGVFPVLFGTPSSIFPHGFGTHVVDLNGDTLADVIQGFSEWEGETENFGRFKSTFKAWLNTGERPYFLKTIHTSAGGEIEVEYTTSVGPENPNLPIIVTTVKRVITHDGLGNLASQLDYTYEGGHYHWNTPLERGLAGFRILTKTDALGFKTKTYFHQSEGSVADSANGESEDHFSKRGMPYRVEIYDNQNQLAQATVNRWDRRDLGNERSFPHLARTVSRLFTPGTPEVKATAQSFEYDAFGNTTRVLDYGEVTVSAEDGTFTDIGMDRIDTENTFVVTSEPYLVGLLSETKLKDQAGALLSHRRFYFDDLPIGGALKGNATRDEVWRDTDDTWIATARTYDEHGLVLEERNPRGYATTFTYDSFHLYPATLTNAKGHVTQITADPATGQALSLTDPNGIVTQNRYDGLGRLAQVKRSDPQNPMEFVTVRGVSYDDRAMPRVVHEIAMADSENSIEHYSYFDGLGRTIEQKREGAGGQWVTSATLFDQRGNVRKTLQPYFSSSSDFEIVDESKLGESFAYDALSRVTSLTNPLGTMTTVYADWKRAVTDMNGNKKEYESDARANLVLVTEHKGEEQYVSRNTYDGLGRLIGTLDAEGNTREFTYNSLGQRLSQTASHAADRPASQWSYGYDENGNLITRTDPKNQITSYEYDELDRMTKEDFAGTPEFELLYVYDQDEFGLGRLSNALTPSYNHAYSYDPWGRVTQEAKQVLDRTFTFNYEYDFLEGMTGLTYPDGAVVTNDYDEAHLLRQVAMGDLVFGQNFTYSPLGQMTEMRLGNGLLVTNTYDPNQLYRLTQKHASSEVAPAVQNFQYTYDPMGNMTQFLDQSEGPTAKTVAYQYDSLYRLTQADYSDLASGGPFAHTFAYSPTGNILQKSDVGEFHYESVHPQAVTQAGAEILEYDLNGNMILRRGNLMTYDYRDRLVNYGDDIEFMYGEGVERVAKINHETGNIKYYPSQYFETDDTKEVKFIYASGLKIASIEVMLERESTPPEGPGDEPDDGPGEEPGDTPAPVLQNVVISPGSGGGGGGRRTALPLFIPKPGSKEVVTFDQSDSKEKIPVFFKPTVTPKTPVEFLNLRVQYLEGKAILTWNAMSEEVKKFQIYRGKYPFYHPKYRYTNEFVADLEPDARKNRLADQADDRYAYRIVALNETGDILATSIELNPEQIYMTEGEEPEIDFSDFSQATFNKVVLMAHDYLNFEAGRTPRHFKIKPVPGFQYGTTIDVRFLECRPKLNGKAYCEKTDEKEIGVFIISRETRFKETSTRPQKRLLL